MKIGQSPDRRVPLVFPLASRPTPYRSQTALPLLAVKHFKGTIVKFVQYPCMLDLPHRQDHNTALDKDEPKLVLQ